MNRNLEDGMMFGSDLINESSINFSITNPVSGTTLEERPLLNALLSVDEYRERYNDYLEEIAKSFFTESNMSQITSQLTSLLTVYVEKDPTKFTTTEQFLEGMSGENSLVEFAVQRADSILKQLSGELIVESEAESGVGNFQPPDMANGDLPELGAGGPPQFANGAPPDRNGEMPNGGPPGAPDGEIPVQKDDPSAENGDLEESSESQAIMINGLCIILLFFAIFYVYRFKRRTI